MELAKLPISFDPLVINRLLRQESLEKLARILRLATIIICALLILYLLYSVVTSLIAVNSETQILQTSVASNNATDGQERAKKIPTDYATLKSQPVFGNLEVKVATKEVVSKPVSTLALNLIGTFITAGEAPYAIIEDDRKKSQDVFNIKDRIFDEATLVAIYSDRVDIDRNGKIEVLKLDLLPSKDTGSSTTTGISEQEGNEFVVEEDELNRAIENLPLVLTQARAVPYFKDGRSVGLRMFAIRSGSIFEKIGLKNGDILKSVNGQSLADLTQAVKLFEKLKEERSVNLVLERDRQDKDFKYQIR